MKPNVNMGGKILPGGAINAEAFRNEILHWLGEGFGVEDIADAAGVEPDIVRDHVDALRKAGRLNFGGKE